MNLLQIASSAKKCWLDIWQIGPGKVFPIKPRQEEPADTFLKTFEIVLTSVCANKHRNMETVKETAKK